MTLKDVQNAKSEIEKLVKEGDFERAHSTEDRILWLFVEEVRKYPLDGLNTRELADAILQLKQIRFPRCCA